MATTAPSPATQHAGAPTLEVRLSRIRTRAAHPHGYRLFDYRPDLLLLVGCIESVLGIHRPQTAAGEDGTVPGASLRRCRVCLHSWPCPTVGAIVRAFTADAR